MITRGHAEAQAVIGVTHYRSHYAITLLYCHLDDLLMQLTLRTLEECSRSLYIAKD